MRYNHFEYGEKLARKLIPIGHTDEDEHYLPSDEVEEIFDLNSRMSDLAGMVLVAIDGHNSDFLYPGDDKLVEIPQFFFAIVNSTDSSDINTIHSAKTRCKVVAVQIIARMITDHNLNSEGLEMLDISSFTIRGIGPIGDNFYGVILSFTMNGATGYALNPEMWQ